MNMQHQLNNQLRTLKLGGFLESLEIRLKQARDEELSHLDFLQRMVQDEIERREATKLQKRLRMAAFEEAKTLEGFISHSIPQIRRGFFGTWLPVCSWRKRSMCSSMVR